MIRELFRRARFLICLLTFLGIADVGALAQAPLPLGITANISSTNVTCNGGSDGTATVSSVSGGTTPYSYSWTPSGGTAAAAINLAAGTYTCTITDALSASTTKTVTVTQPATLSISGTGSFCTSTTLTASMTGGTWSSSNTAVATVGTSGTVTGLVGGTAVITYTHSCGSATKGVTVNLPNPGTITGLQTVCVTAFIAHSTTGDAGGTWVSSNVAVGTINPATGTMGGASNGTTTLSYTVTNGCGSATATIVNTVYALTDPGTISGPSSVCTGATISMASSSTTTSTPPYSHAWSSSATAIATVNAATGVVTGLAGGTSRISYTATGCGTFRTFFTVNVLPTSAAAITGTTTVTAGSTTTLSNATTGGTWSSTNTAVGTVSTSGVVTGISAGTTTISYLISNSCGTSASTVNVTVIGPLSATQSQTDVTCNGGSDGTATVVASGGTPSYTYSWAPSGGTAATATGLTAGSYTCTITDAASSSINKTFTIAEPAALAVTGSGTLCATTTLTASVAGGTWSSDNTAVATVGSTGVVTGVGAGTCTISYVHSCGTATKGVTVNLANPGTITGLQTVCVTAFIAHSTTGTAGGTWVSSNVAVGTINSATGTMGGASNGTTTVSYTVTNGCGSMTATKVNTVYALTDPGTISGPSSVCAGSDVSMSSSSTTTSAPPYSHAWSSSATAIATVNAATGVVTGMAAGTSRISYTATGCGTFRTFFTMNVLPTTVNAITGTTTVATGATTTLSNTTSGGTWSSTNTAVGTVGTSGIVTGISAGTTTISYLISNSCGTSASTVNVTVVGALSATQSQTNITCNGGSDGTATVVASGGTPAYTYSWAPSGGTAATATGLTAGSYTCTITDAASVSINKTFTITEPAALSVTGSGTLCATTTLTASMAGGTWSSSNTAVATVGSTGIVSGLVGGTAIITYTHSCGSATKGVTVNLPNPGTITGLQTVCVTAFIAHGTTGDAGGTWVSSNVAVGTINPATGTMGGASNGTTTVSYTVTNGCGSATATIVNTVYALTDPGTISGPSSVCAGANISMSSSSTTTSTPPYSHAWSSSATAIATVNAATGVVTGMSGGTSRISYTATGCGTFRTFFTVNVLPIPTVNPTITGVTTVATSSTTTLGNAATGGVWTSDNTGIATIGSSSGIATGVAVGSTTVSYTITNSCGTATATTNLTVISSFSATQSQTNITCFGANNGTASVVVSGGTPPYSYSWAPSGGTASSASGLSAGTYTCTITDDASNTITKTFTITSPTALTVSLSSQTNISCNGGSNGSATVFATGGTGGAPPSAPSLPVGYMYSWAPYGGTLATATGLTAGTYTCTVTDYNGCTATQVVTITQPTALTSSVSAQTNVSCFGGSNGSATVTASGGTTGIPSAPTPLPSYAYSWAPYGGTSATATGLGAGSFTCTVTDLNGCTSVQVVTITQPSAFTITSVAGGGTVCGGSNISFTSAATGGTSPVAYSWAGPNSFSSTLQNPTITAATAAATGTYTVTITDANSCTATGDNTASATVISLSAITGTASIIAGNTTTLSNATAGGVWSSSNTAVATVNSESGEVTGVGNGSVVITYTVGTCSRTFNMTVIAPASPITGNLAVCVGGTTNLSGTGTGASWTIDNTSIATIGVTSGVVIGIAPGTATITFTANSGATSTAVLTVNLMPAEISGSLAVCEGATTTLTDVNGGGNWTSSNPLIAAASSSTGVITGASAGTSIITYTLAGCSKIAMVTVNPAPSVISGANTVCTGSSAALSTTTTGGTWSSSDAGIASVNSGGIVTGNATGVATISYTITATGCSRTKSITVTGAATANTGNAAICTGSTTTLSNPVSGGIWSSSNTAIANVNVASGLVTPVAAGTVAISYAVSSGCNAVTIVTVTTTPASITGAASVNIGESITLANTTTGGVWSSSNAALGSVDAATGVVTGIAAGNVAISYAIGSCYKTTIVTVNAAPNAIEGPLTVCVGLSINLSNPQIGQSWTSSNPAVATIGSASGVITGITPGTTVITFTALSGATAIRIMTVNPQPSVITGPGAVCIGSSVTFANADAGGTWSSGNIPVAAVNGTTGVISGMSTGTSVITYNLAGCIAIKGINVNPVPATISGQAAICTGSSSAFSDVTTGGTWSSGNTSIATVGTNGVVNGVSAGNTTITYTTTSTGCFQTKQVTVGPMPANTGTQTACLGSTTTLANTGGGVWTSSTPSVASVAAGTGIVTGLALGTANITYTLTAGCKATTIVTVLPTASNVTGPTSVCINASVTLSDASPSGMWSSSNTGLATIDATTGVVTGVAAGTATMTYAIANGCFKTYNVTVKALPVAIVGNKAICVGGTSIVTNPTPVGQSWASSNSSVATIGAGSGLITGIAPGTALITYTINTGCAITAEVTVSAAASAGTITGPASVSVAGSAVTPVLYSNTATGGTWSSSNTARATIGSASGLVRGFTAGAVTLSYLAPTGCRTTLPITITTPRAADDAPIVTEADNSIQLYPNPTPGSFTIKAGTSGTLRLYTLEGKETAAFEVKEGANVVNMPYGTAAGMYMARFADDNGNITTIRIVYQP